MTMQEFAMGEEERRWEAEIESVEAWWRTEHQRTVTRQVNQSRPPSLSLLQAR